MTRSRCVVLLGALVAAPAGPAAADAPALREQVSLDGAWDEGGVVPQYAGLPKFDERTYRRTVAVPASWAGKVVKLEFGAVNFIAEVYVDDRPVGGHVGGWNPFAIDATDRVAPGSPFALKVIVKGAKHPPMIDDRGKFLWPVGGWSDRGGIADSVWLRAYGAVHIEDAFIRTSYRERSLAVEYTLKNADDRPRAVTLRGDAARPGADAPAATVAAEVTLGPGERKTVVAQADWPDPDLYWPDRPALYHLESQLRDGDAVLDRETRRFGFREFWVEGNQFRLNGVRVNLYGDYQTVGDTWYNRPEMYEPANWPATVDRIKALNIRVLRWHHNPVPQYILDVMDETGLLACDESANYARPFLVGCDRDAYVANFREWAGPWIRADRNHPSVYLWNATNEMTYPHLGQFTAAQCRAMGDAIARHDATRPVGYDGDAEDGWPRKFALVEGPLVNRHYPEGYNKEPAGSIYGWADRVHPTRPTGLGEVLHTKSPLKEVQVAVERNTWWLGVWTRGLRYTGWTDVRPACYWFASKDLDNPDPKWRVRGENLRNAYAPVALFDKEYDDLGIAPFVTGTTPGGTLPEVRAGETLRRTLVLYNDEFRGEEVAVEVLVRCGGATHARGAGTFRVGLGEHRDIPYSFQVPRVGGSEVEVVRTTHKAGITTFEEARRFRVVGATGGGPTADRVTLDGQDAR